jgi:hypothetical protein
MMNLRVLLFLLHIFFEIVTSSKYCIDNSTVIYLYNGEPSIIGTFISCLRSTQDALISPFYDDGKTVNVTTEVILNNLINVDEVSSSVELDFFFITSWVRSTTPIR